MKIGDRYYTIAYSHNTRVIEVEVLAIENIDDEEFVHLQNVDNIYDRWFVTLDFANQWKFPTRELAEVKLKSL